MIRRSDLYSYKYKRVPIYEKNYSACTQYSPLKKMTTRWVTTENFMKDRVPYILTRKTNFGRVKNSPFKNQRFVKKS